LLKVKYPSKNRPKPIARLFQLNFMSIPASYRVAGWPDADVVLFFVSNPVSGHWPTAAARSVRHPERVVAAKTVKV